MRNYDIGVLATSQEYFHVASIFAKKHCFILYRAVIINVMTPTLS